MKIYIGNTDITKVIDSVKEEVRAIRERDPAAVSDAEVLLLYSGLHAVLLHRVAHSLHKKGKTLPARAISQFNRAVTGVEIHPAAKIGKGVFIDHGSGVVIGETAEVGDNCTIYQGVTLGGTGKHTGKRHPTLGNNVMVGAGAKVLGPFKVGDNSKIAAGAVVLHEVPNNATAVGVPARNICSDKKPCTQELDQVNIPDPLAAELDSIRKRLERLEENK